MILWITRQRREDYYTISYFKPVISTVGNTEERDCYSVYGDPFFKRDFCKESMVLLFGKSILNLKSTESIQKEILGRDLKPDITKIL
jgi:hypothetical protein